MTKPYKCNILHIVKGNILRKGDLIMNREDYERALTVRLFQASNALQVMLDKILKKDDLTAKQFFMMIMVDSFEADPNINDLSQIFKTSHQNVKQVLLKLEKKSFINMYKDPNDKRILRVSMTDEAKTFWLKRDKQDEARMHDLFKDMPTEHLEIVLKTFMTLINQIERVDT